LTNRLWSLFLVLVCVFTTSCGSGISSEQQKFNSLCDDLVVLTDDALMMRIKYEGEFYERIDSLASNFGFLTIDNPDASELQRGLQSFSKLYQEQYGRNSAPTGYGIIPLEYLIETYCGITYTE
jgi:hypothetical protein